MLRRLAPPLVLLALLVTATPSMAQPADAPPTTPRGLVANAYSGTAGAIRWERSTDDAGAVVGYELTRDGTALGVFDALSYVDGGLRAGTRYRYTVTAIDRAGQRSGTAAVTLETPGGGAGPAAPQALRGSVYSTTAAEIAWARASVPGLRYEVRRDGRTLATSDGTSYFDASLAPGRSYVYEVVAIDVRGRRSAPSSVMLNTPGGTGTGSGPVVRPGTSALDLPIGVRLAVYDARSFELFWERYDGYDSTGYGSGVHVDSGSIGRVFGPGDYVPVLRHRLRRDGVVVQDGSAISRYVSDVEPGRRYGYELEQIDRDGRVVRAVRFTVDPAATPQLAAAAGSEALPPPDPTATATAAIRRAGYVAARDAAEGLLEADFLASLIDATPAIRRLADTVPFADAAEGQAPQARDCPAGGVANVRRQTSVSQEGRSRVVYDLSFGGCRLDGGERLDGGLRLAIGADEEAVALFGSEGDRDGAAGAFGYEYGFDGFVFGAGGTSFLLDGYYDANRELTPVEDGACTAEGVRREGESVFAALSGELSDARGATSFAPLSIRYQATVQSVRDAASGACRDIASLLRDDSLSGNPGVLEGRAARLERYVDIGPVEPVSDRDPLGRLQIAVDDGSALYVSLSSVDEGTVRVDVVDGGDGRATSFFDRYRF